jgi:hypothetical protein
MRLCGRATALITYGLPGVPSRLHRTNEQRVAPPLVETANLLSAFRLMLGTRTLCRPACLTALRCPSS